MDRYIDSFMQAYNKTINASQDHRDLLRVDLSTGRRRAEECQEKVRAEFLDSLDKLVEAIRRLHNVEVQMTTTEFVISESGNSFAKVGMMFVANKIILYWITNYSQLTSAVILGLNSNRMIGTKEGVSPLDVSGRGYVHDPVGFILQELKYCLQLMSAELGTALSLDFSQKSKTDG